MTVIIDKKRIMKKKSTRCNLKYFKVCFFHGQTQMTVIIDKKRIMKKKSTRCNLKYFKV